MAFRVMQGALAGDEIIYDAHDPVLLEHMIGEKTLSLARVPCALTMDEIDKIHQVVANCCAD